MWTPETASSVQSPGQGTGAPTVNVTDAPAEIQAFNQQAWPVISTTGLAHVLRDAPHAGDELSPALAAACPPSCTAP